MRVPFFLFVKFDETCRPRVFLPPPPIEKIPGAEVAVFETVSQLSPTFYILRANEPALLLGIQRRQPPSRDSSGFKTVLQFHDGRRNRDKDSSLPYVRKSATKIRARGR